MKASYPVAVAGEGCYIIDESGKRYLDGSGGAAVSCLCLLYTSPSPRD